MVTGIIKLDRAQADLLPLPGWVCGRFGVRPGDEHSAAKVGVRASERKRASPLPSAGHPHPTLSLKGEGSDLRDHDLVGEVVPRARACLGARFRTHGRDPRFGLDCVGVAAVAFGREVGGGYALRGGNPARVIAEIEDYGLVRAEGRPRPGDLLLIDAGAGQLHLGITTGAGFVHACARLRRVVETPGTPAGTILGIWREI